MEFDDIVRKRKMIRRYLPKKISEKIISKLIRNASRSPSASQPQIQEFIIVGNPAVRNTTRT
jgi:nitroreductase